MRHLGLHRFAHLRPVAEDQNIAQCAARYSGTEHNHEARSAHQLTIDAVRAIARRRSKPWRLVGLSIRITGMDRPTVETFAEGRLEVFSDAEVLKLYQEAFSAGRASSLAAQTPIRPAPAVGDRGRAATGQRPS